MNDLNFDAADLCRVWAVEVQQSWSSGQPEESFSPARKNPELTWRKTALGYLMVFNILNLQVLREHKSSAEKLPGCLWIPG